MPAETIPNVESHAPDSPRLGYPEPGYPPRKRWTRSECETLEATGLWEHERLELIEGDLISKMGKKRPHVNTMMLVMEWMVGVFGTRNVNTRSTDRRFARGQPHERA